MRRSSSDVPPVDLAKSTGDGPSENPLGSDLPDSQLSEEERRELTSQAFWQALSTIHRQRRWIFTLTLLAAIGSVVFSLMLPVWYAASTRVLPPEGGGGEGLGALIGDLSPIAASFLGGGGGDYGRYLAILGSRTTLHTVVDRFDLIEVYDTGSKLDPLDSAIRQLRSNTEFEVDLETNALTLTIYDQDPVRAAQIANFLVNELNRRNEQLAVEGATRFRDFVEGRYAEIEVRMDSALSAMTEFQRRNGVIELPSMAQGLIEATVAQQAEIGQIEVQYEALLSELGPENPQVVAARRALETARQGQSNLLNGREAVMPVAREQLPILAGEYARLYQDVLIQQALMEQARPILEQARFDEERDRVAVQVVDPAVPPSRKARPKRSIIVVAATISAFVFAILVALLEQIYSSKRPLIAAALWSDK